MTTTNPVPQSPPAATSRRSTAPPHPTTDAIANAPAPGLGLGSTTPQASETGAHPARSTTPHRSDAGPPGPSNATPQTPRADTHPARSTTPHDPYAEPLGPGGTTPRGSDTDAHRVPAATPLGSDVGAGVLGERPLRIVVVDDDNLMRAGLCAVLSSDDSILIVGEAADGAAAVEVATTLAPDVMLMDIRMPVLDGIEATRRIAAAAPGVRILVLTTFEDDDYVLGALRSGAAGFVLKRIRPEQLIEAIHTVAAGDKLLAPEVTSAVVEQLTRQAEPDATTARRLARLTPRERDVLVLIGRGLSNGEIAAGLVVEESTVKSHIKRVLAKLELRDRIHAVILAYETGLVRPGDRAGPAPPGK